MEQIQIYNTDSNSLKIVGLPDGMIQVKMYSLLGKKLLDETLESKENLAEIGLDSYAKGMYIVSLKSDQRVMSKKIILQ